MVLLLLVALPLLAETPPVPPIALPQARIDAIDASQWPKLRILARSWTRRGDRCRPRR